MDNNLFSCIVNISKPFMQVVGRILGTGHKVFTRGCGGYSWGVRKKIRTSKGGTKILVGNYLNLGGVRKKINFYKYVEY